VTGLAFALGGRDPPDGLAGYPPRPDVFACLELTFDVGQGGEVGQGEPGDLPRPARGRDGVDPALGTGQDLARRE
jgi:hypothetical protein